ncbi:SAM-dependent methyltransferase [Candidatus Saccharibacteria bacterium]|nr:SAM-dependent methyltransferase [Candidatus Saccharibacteria bacterium]MCA9328318.1 SAM-dependent methyltransferase [Candidatus Saccharibacteria bacterium]
MTDQNTTQRHSSSFRDPEGYVVSHKGKILRVVGRSEKENYDKLMDSGLYDKAVSKKLLVNHKEIKDISSVIKDQKVYKILEPSQIPIISYPYEWSFDQLKDAALLTLDLLKLAVEHGMTLKDASAYNVQFVGSNPIFIDTTSFEIREDTPWVGYKQFCEHFLVPLSLMKYNDQYLHRMPRLFIDGVPLHVAVKVLPARARLNAGIAQHVFLHARSQARHQKAGAKHIEQGKKLVKVPKMSKFQQLAIIDSLRRTVKSLSPRKMETEWGDYYDFTNYNRKSFSEKQKLVEKLIKKANPKKSVWDFGANNGEFSSIASRNNIYTVAFDIDPNAVNKNYNQFKGDENMLPLLLDLTNPSPSIGWGLEERASIIDRGPSDLLMALALIHHISIGNNVPFPQVAKFFSECGKNLIIEFVPKGDSKVDTLLSTRKDIFDNYNEEDFEKAFNQYFKIVEKVKIPKSKRTLYLMRRK